MRIWIDTDIGSDVDDALALAYVVRHPELELAGVSTVFGDTPLRTRIASELLARTGDANAPVVTGLGLPLTAAMSCHMSSCTAPQTPETARNVARRSAIRLYLRFI